MADFQRGLRNSGPDDRDSQYARSRFHRWLKPRNSRSAALPPQAGDLQALPGLQKGACRYMAPREILTRVAIEVGERSLGPSEQCSHGPMPATYCAIHPPAPSSAALWASACNAGHSPGRHASSCCQHSRVIRHPGALSANSMVKQCSLATAATRLSPSPDPPDDRAVSAR